MVGSQDDKFEDSCSSGSGEPPMLIMDVFDVDQYGCLLADIRSVRVGQNTNILAQWTFAEQCVDAGWAYTMALHNVSHRVAEAFKQAKRNRVGGWVSRQTKDFSERLTYAGDFTTSNRTKGRRREFWMPGGE